MQPDPSIDGNGEAVPPPPLDSNRIFYDRIAVAYDRIADERERPAREAGVRALAVQSGEHVLEVGFGTGNEILALAALVGPTGKVTGLDISAGMMSVTIHKLQQEQPNASIDLKLADAREMPFADAVFDAVYLSFTLELFTAADVSRVLGEIRRVLKPRGRLAVVALATVPSGGHGSAAERTYVWMHRHFPHLVDCRPLDVAGVLHDAGFVVNVACETDIWTMPVRCVVGTKQ